MNEVQKGLKREHFRKTEFVFPPAESGLNDRFIPPEQLGVPDLMGEFSELFLCHWCNGIVEDFHARYYDGMEVNKHYRYKNTNMIEFGFVITHDERVRNYFSGCSNSQKNYVLNCLMESAITQHDIKHIRFDTICGILKGFRQKTLAFIFSSNWMLGEGIVLYRDSQFLSEHIIKERFVKFIKSCDGDKLYLCVVQDDDINLISLN